MDLHRLPRRSRATLAVLAIAALAAFAGTDSASAQGEIYNNPTAASAKAAKPLPQSKAAAAIRARLQAKEQAVLQAEIDKLNAAYQAAQEENQRLREQLEAADASAAEARQQAQQELSNSRQQLDAAEQRASENERQRSEAGATLADTSAQLDALAARQRELEASLAAALQSRWQWAAAAAALAAAVAAIVSAAAVRRWLPRRLPVQQPVTVSAALGGWKFSAPSVAPAAATRFSLQTQWLPGPVQLQMASEAQEQK